MENHDGLRDLLIFVMIYDEPSMYRTKALDDYLNELCKNIGYRDWIDAYHNL